MEDSGGLGATSICDGLLAGYNIFPTFLPQPELQTADDTRTGLSRTKRISVESIIHNRAIIFHSIVKEAFNLKNMLGVLNGHHRFNHFTFSIDSSGLLSISQLVLKIAITYCISRKKKMEVGRETLRVNRCGLTKPPSCVFMCYASSFCNLSFLQTLLLRQKRVIKTGRVKVTNQSHSCCFSFVSFRQEPEKDTEKGYFMRQRKNWKN